MSAMSSEKPFSGIRDGTILWPTLAPAETVLNLVPALNRYCPAFSRQLAYGHARHKEPYVR